MLVYYFCKRRDVSFAIFVRRRDFSACPIMLSTKHGSHWCYFNAFGMARPGFESATPTPEADALSLSHRDYVQDR